MAETLYEIGTRHGTDKAGQRQLLYHYDAFFSHLRGEEVTLLEIGVFRGESLAMWADYFPRARIYGIDIDPGTAAYSRDRIEVLLGSQSDTHFLDSVISRIGRPHIVIDDGSHLARDQVTSLTQLWPAVLPAGFYVVEDIHTSYMPDYNMRWREPGTAVEFLKGIVDDIHERWHDRPVAFRDCQSLVFVQEACIMRKRPEAI